MKKRIYIFVLSLFVVVLIAVVLIESNSKSPKDRFIETSETVESEMTESSLITSISSGEAITEKSEPDLSIIFNLTHTVQYEFLSYEMVDDTDIAKQTKYKAEFFADGKVPDPDYFIEKTDYMAMRKDYPQVDEYISSNGTKGMTDDEYHDFMEKHLDEYTSKRHPKTKYLFLHCRISNVGQGPVEEYINELSLYAVRGDNTIGKEELNCYFDKSMYIEGDERVHHFFLYRFGKNEETLDCVIGFEISEERVDLSEENSYFVGFEPIGLDNPLQFDPSLDKGFVAVDKLSNET